MLVMILITGFQNLCSQTICMRFGGPNSEYAYDIFSADHSSFLIAGSTDSYGAGSSDLYVIKFNAYGVAQWTRTVGDVGNEIGYAIDQATNGDYIVAGETNSFGTGGDMYVVRLDSMGNLLWTASIGGASYDYAREIAATADNGCVVVGASSSYGLGFEDSYVAKLDSLGNLQWARTIGDVNTEGAYAVLASSDGNIVVAQRGFPVAGAAQLYVTKMTYGAVVLWSKHFASHDANDFFVPGDIIEANGGYVISGFVDTVLGTNKNTFLTKISPNGTHQWTRIIGLPGNDNGYSLQPAVDGGYIISGSYFGATAKAFIAKTDTFGIPYWFTRSNAAANNYSYGAVELMTGSFYTVGNTDAFGQDIFMMRLDAQGRTCCGDSMVFSTGLLSRITGNYGTLGAGAIMDAGGTIDSGGITALICPPDTIAIGILPVTGGTGQVDTDDIEDDEEAGNAGLEDQINGVISIYPNPTSGYIHVLLPQNIGKNCYELLNLHGQVLQTGSFVTNPTLLNIEDIPKGIYILKVNNYHVKIIKQ